MDVTGVAVTPKFYDILRMAVEQGVAYGWRRAHKYEEKPTDETATDVITQAVLNEIHEWFVFPSSDET